MNTIWKWETLTTFQSNQQKTLMVSGWAHCNRSDLHNWVQKILPDCSLKQIGLLSCVVFTLLQRGIFVRMIHSYWKLQALFLDHLSKLFSSETKFYVWYEPLSMHWTQWLWPTVHRMHFEGWQTQIRLGLNQSIILDRLCWKHKRSLIQTWCRKVHEICLQQKWFLQTSRSSFNWFRRSRYYTKKSV